MERVEFENGSWIECSPDYDSNNTIRGKSARNSIVVLGRNNGKDIAKLKAMLEEEDIEMIQGDIKFLDKDGNEQAKIPAHSDLLNAVVGYDHDPRTHNYNRAERRRIIKEAKRLDKKYSKR